MHVNELTFADDPKGLANTAAEDYTDGDEDEDEDDGDDSEKEWRAEHIEELRAKAAKAEDKAREARAKLRESNERKKEVSLKNASGEWKLYSSAYLTAVIGANDLDWPVDEVDEDSGAIGELRIGKEYVEDALPHAKNELGAELDLHGLSEYSSFQFRRPKHASLDPIDVYVWDMDDESAHKCPFVLLGNGVLELHYPSHIIPKAFRAAGDVVLVGIQS